MTPGRSGESVWRSSLPYTPRPAPPARGFPGRAWEAPNTPPKFPLRTPCPPVAPLDPQAVVLLCPQKIDRPADRAVFDGVADKVVDRVPGAIGIAHGHAIG